jgi:hypothetical protein
VGFWSGGANKGRYVNKLSSKWKITCLVIPWSISWLLCSPLSDCRDREYCLTETVSHSISLVFSAVLSVVPLSFTSSEFDIKQFLSCFIVNSYILVYLKGFIINKAQELWFNEFVLKSDPPSPFYSILWICIEIWFDFYQCSWSDTWKIFYCGKYWIHKCHSACL